MSEGGLEDLVNARIFLHAGKQASQQDIFFSCKSVAQDIFPY